MQSAGNITLDGTATLIRKIIPFTFVFEFAGGRIACHPVHPGIWRAARHLRRRVPRHLRLLQRRLRPHGRRAPFSSLTAYVSDPLVS